MAGLLELALDRLIGVEFAIDDDPCLFVLAGDRLIAGRKIDDAEAGMSERNPPVGGNPVTLAVGATMPETAGRPLQRGCGNRFTLREKGHNTAHAWRL